MVDNLRLAVLTMLLEPPEGRSKVKRLIVLGILSLTIGLCLGWAIAAGMKAATDSPAPKAIKSKSPSVALPHRIASEHLRIEFI